MVVAKYLKLIWNHSGINSGTYFRGSISYTGASGGLGSHILALFCNFEQFSLFLWMNNYIECCGLNWMNNFFEWFSENMIFQNGSARATHRRQHASVLAKIATRTPPSLTIVPQRSGSWKRLVYYIISMPHNCRHCNFTFPHLHPKEKERKRFESRRKQQHIRFLASIRAGCLCAGDHCRAGIISKSCATQVQLFELFGIIISNAS